MSRPPRSIPRAGSAPARRALVAALLTALFAGCRATPERVPPPLFDVTSDHHAGSALTGPLPLDDAVEVEVEAATATSPWIVEFGCRWIAVLDATSTDALSSVAKHVFASDSSPPLKTRGDMAVDGMWVSGAVRLGDDGVSDGAALRRLDALAPGTTVVFDIAPNAMADGPLEPRWESLTLNVWRAASDETEPDAAALSLAFEGWVTTASADDTPEAEAVYQAEHLILAPRLVVGGEPARFFLPAPRVNEASGGLLVELALHAPQESPSTDETAAIERARDNLAQSALHARASTESLTRDDGLRLERTSTLPALDQEDLRRPAIIFLTEATGAAFAGDVALIADDAHLAEYVESARAQLDGIEAHSMEAGEFAWFIEKSAYLWLVGIIDDEERELPPALFAALLRHTGELGRYADLVREAVVASRSLDELAARVERENRYFLEDGHPAARLRAFEWLDARNIAPAAYDPLASRAERRGALAAAEEPGE